MEEHSTTEDDMCKLPSLVEAPCLILTHRNYKSEFDNQTFYLMNNKSYTKTIVELHGKSILASTQGWLILREQVNRSRYSIWNPITRQCISLPELLDPPEEEERPQTCMFTSPPDGNSPCVVLLFFKSLVFLCRPAMRDDCRWVKQTLVYEGRSVKIVEAAALDGDIYVIAVIMNNSSDNKHDYRGGYNIFGRIKVCDCTSNLVLFEPLKIKPPCGSIMFIRSDKRRNFLLEVCGVLYIVRIFIDKQSLFEYDIVKAYVWRLDLPQMKWIQVESLGGSSVFSRPIIVPLGVGQTPLARALKGIVFISIGNGGE